MSTALGTLIVLVGCTILLTLGARFFDRLTSGGAPFQPSEPAPWPRGVQEDDDVHWTWRDR